MNILKIIRSNLFLLGVVLISNSNGIYSSLALSPSSKIPPHLSTTTPQTKRPLPSFGGLKTGVAASATIINENVGIDATMTTPTTSQDEYEEYDDRIKMKLMNVIVEETNSFTAEKPRHRDIGAGMTFVSQMSVTEASRKRFSAVGKIGTKDMKSIAHTSLGTLSLLLGTWHTASCLMGGFETQVLSQEGFIMHGIIHMLTAMIGVTRLDFENQKDSHRNALIWPVPIQNTWCLVVGLSDFVQIQEKSLFSIYSDSMLEFTMLYLVLCLYQTVASFNDGGVSEQERQQSGLWFENKYVSVSFLIVGYTLIFGSYCSEVIFINRVVDPSTLNSFVSTHPEYSRIVGNVQLVNMWTSNVAVFLATLLRYKALNSFQIRAFYIPLQLGPIIPIILAFFHADGGSWRDVVHLFGIEI